MKTPEDYADEFDRMWGISQEEKDCLVEMFKMAQEEAKVFSSNALLSVSVLPTEVLEELQNIATRYDVLIDVKYPNGKTDR